MKTMLRRGAPLVSPDRQIEALNRPPQPKFARKMEAAGLFPLRPTAIDTLQINVGKMCNQTCHHCHVDAGPDRTEIMTRETMAHCLTALRETAIHTVDLTGGAPEMNPHFRWFVEQIRAIPREIDIIVRCNLTILLAGEAYRDLPEFFARHRVHVISSLPCYSKRNTDQQRGIGVFDKSITALQRLNAVGYGRAGSGLTLDLVYNPVGAFLPPPQAKLESDYQHELQELFGISFNHLFAITNLPVSRFLEALVEQGQLDTYLEKLVTAFNPEAAKGVMCRNLISVGWDGRLYDCDFNQMLELPVDAAAPQHIRDFALNPLQERAVVVNQHCFGCTAGAGSSCGGITADKGA